MLRGSARGWAFRLGIGRTGTAHCRADLIYEHLTRDFEARRTAGTASLTSASLLVSGLAAVHDLTVSRHDLGVVIWTSGEASRRLHLLFAYEDLGACTRGQISDITGYSTRTVGNLIPSMFDDLVTLDAGLRRGADERGHQLRQQELGVLPRRHAAGDVPVARWRCLPPGGPGSAGTQWPA